VNHKEIVLDRFPLAKCVPLYNGEGFKYRIATGEGLKWAGGTKDTPQQAWAAASSRVRARGLRRVSA
jgi:hypothetical protein